MFPKSEVVLLRLCENLKYTISNSSQESSRCLLSNSNLWSKGGPACPVSKYYKLRGLDVLWQLLDPAIVACSLKTAK